ncbi:MAG: hypothetical protein V4812_14195 [Pseudomonadota bacterium]
MSNYIALTSNPNPHPVLVLDASASFSDLQESAQQRLSAAKGLLLSLACMSITHASTNDLNNVADAAYLLLEDASDLFKAAGTAAVRREVPHG